MLDAASSPGAPDGAPSVGWARGPLGTVQAADREISRQTAVRARAVAAFAATRPSSSDRPPGTPGAMSADRRAARAEVLADVSEWAAQELVVALSISDTAAQQLLERSLTLVHRLPRTLGALESGSIHVGHLWPLLDKVAPITDASIRTRVEREVLDWVAGRGVTTPAQLGAKVRRSVVRHDAAAAAQRLAQALRVRGISVRTDRREGMAVVDALLTVPEAQALVDALGRYADALDDPDDRRTRGQRMADILLELVLRPGDHEHGPVRAQLTVVAGVATLLGGGQPGEVGGEPVPAEMVRALARALGLLPEDAPTEDAPATRDAATTDRGVDAAGGPTARGTVLADDWFPADGSPEAEALEAWWAAVEERALSGEWHGAEAPPLEVLERWWAEEARWNEPLPPESPPPTESSPPPESFPPPPSPAPAPAPDGSSPASGTAPSMAGTAGIRGPADTGWWAAADRAVDAAGEALLELHRATAAADRTVTDAVRAATADEAAWHDSAPGRMTRARGALDALREASTQQRVALARLLDRGAGGGLLDRPRIAVVDELTGALLCLTDSDELRRSATCGARSCRRDPARCDHDLSGRPGLGLPGPTDGYRPRTSLDRFVRARDRRCRFPGCRRRVPLSGELDHDRPWPGGPTDAGNLVGYCTGHHRGKHQAPGWRHHVAVDGTLTVTTPTGVVASTTPPPF